jgi:hemin uptake protein HemP
MFSPMFSPHAPGPSHRPAGPADPVRDAASAPLRAAPPAAAPEVDSRQLLAGRRELLIRHGGEHYRLRHTRNDKLILTK